MGTDLKSYTFPTNFVFEPSNTPNVFFTHQYFLIVDIHQNTVEIAQLWQHNRGNYTTPTIYQTKNIPQYSDVYEWSLEEAMRQQRGTTEYENMSREYDTHESPPTHTHTTPQLHPKNPQRRRTKQMPLLCGVVTGKRPSHSAI